MTEQWKMTDDEGSDANLTPEGEGRADEGGFSERHKPRISANTLAVLGVFGVTLALIWALGKEGGPRTASAAGNADALVDTAIQELQQRSSHGGSATDLSGNTDELVKMFYNYPGVTSVPLEDLPSNPFAHDTGRAAEPTDPHPAMAVNPSPEADARLRKLAEAFSKLKLTTVLVSKTNSAALINNRLVMVGAKVGDFTVAAIAPDHVMLSVDSETYELKIDEPRGLQAAPQNGP